MRSLLPSGTPVELTVPADGRSPSRGLVLLPDIGGLRPLFDAHAQTLADDNGWAVAAVEPWPGREHLTIDERLELVGTIDDGALLADVIAAADLLGVEPVGITGFCMGGMFTMKAAGTGRFHRAVSFYGMFRVPARWKVQQASRRPFQRALAALGMRRLAARMPVSDRGVLEPLDAAQSPRACPTMAVVGTLDHWTPPADVEAARAAGITVVAYEGAEHAFVHDTSRASHRPTDAEDAWRRAIAFLGQ